MDTVKLPRPMVHINYFTENYINNNNPILIHFGILRKDNDYIKDLHEFSNSFERNIIELDASSRSYDEKDEFHILELVSDLVSTIKKFKSSKAILVGHGIGGKACSLAAQLYVSQFNNHN